MHLDLDSFKTQPCKINGQHNPKLCVYYHSSKDRRRSTPHSHELCSNPDNCPLGDSCPKAHNRVEQLYHPEKYKTKFCSYFPNNLDYCDYQSFCSFAHSERDIKVELIHNLVQDSDFYIYFFKTVWCPYNSPHDKAACPYAHNWQDYRRKPHECEYSNMPCPYWKSGTFILSYEEAG